MKKTIRLTCKNCKGTGKISKKENTSILEDLFKAFVYNSQIKCPRCNGTGTFVKVIYN